MGTCIKRMLFCLTVCVATVFATRPQVALAPLELDSTSPSRISMQDLAQLETTIKQEMANTLGEKAEIIDNENQDYTQTNFRIIISLRTRQTPPGEFLVARIFCRDCEQCVLDLFSTDDSLDSKTPITSEVIRNMARQSAQSIVNYLNKVTLFPNSSKGKFATNYLLIQFPDAPANVSIDGHTVCWGSSECKIKATQGPHRIKAHRAGFLDQSETIRYPNGNNIYTLKLHSKGLQGMEVMESNCKAPKPDSGCNHGFYMDQTEVTQDDFMSVMGINPSKFKACGGACPVEQVTWNEAKTYCARLQKHLPTQAEWEYAARTGTTQPWQLNSTADLDAQAWYSTNSSAQTHTVAQKKGNEWGLHDMAGNVWEWIADSMSLTRTIRGGGWATLANANSTESLDPKLRRDDVGFRCAKTNLGEPLYRNQGMGDMLGGLLCFGVTSISTRARGTVAAPKEQDIHPSDTSRSVASLMAVVRARTPGLRHIYNKFLKLRPDFLGKVALTVTVMPSGEIINAHIAQSSTGFEEFDTEIVQAISAWRFKTLGETAKPVTITLPFTFFDGCPPDMVAP